MDPRECLVYIVPQLEEMPEILHLRSVHAADVGGKVVDGLMRPVGQRELPTILLYDERGLRLYDDITTEAPEYYLFPAEEGILKDHANDIARAMHHHSGSIDVVDGEVVLELGAGSLRKTSHILLGLSQLVQDKTEKAPITYYALDLEERELQRTLGEITASNIGHSLHGKVETKGMCGTYDEGLKYIEEGGLFPSKLSGPDDIKSLGFADRRRRLSEDAPESPTSSDKSPSNVSSSLPSTPDEVQPPLHILFLGSSLGNFSRDASVSFLRSLPLRPGSGDTLLLGLDHDNPKEAIEKAYNDPKGYTKEFIMNGLKAAGKALGDENMFDLEKWDYFNQYNSVERRHEAFYRSRCPQTIYHPATKQAVQFLENELVKIEESYKYSEKDTFSLFTESDLRPIQRWTDATGNYSLWLLERPSFSFPLLKAPTALSSPFTVPSVDDWKQMWAAWDCVSRQMIPPSMLYQKPIDLRHICLFYLGHIPAFLDIHLSRLLNEPNTEPEHFKYIFERGIDPNVDDPTQCHPHSEVPEKEEDWPNVTSVLQYQDRVRERLLALYDDIRSGKIALTRKIARVLFMTFEHEGLHVETLLYMLLQRAGTGTLPPPGFAVPLWDALVEMWNAAPKPAKATVVLGPAEVEIGHDDSEEEDANPATRDDVEAHEFGWDNEHPKRRVNVEKFEISWRPVTNGEFYEFYSGEGKDKVRLPASWVEIDGEVQVRTLYGPVPIRIAYHWPVITSYDNISTYAIVKGGRIPTEPELRLFYEKFESGYEGGANLGFRHWHPVPATTGGERDGGRGSNGGVWEWTSTVFDKYDGFVPSALYPGYSMDFFDNAHNVVLGGSFATIPRIAERKSFRNWYQRNYPYPWAGARIAYDITK